MFPDLVTSGICAEITHDIFAGTNLFFFFRNPNASYSFRITFLWIRLAWAASSLKHFGFRLSRNPTEVDFSPGFRDAFLLSGDAQVNVGAANPKPEIATAIVNSEGGTLSCRSVGISWSWKGRFPPLHFFRRCATGLPLVQRLLDIYRVTLVKPRPYQSTRWRSF